MSDGITYFVKTRVREDEVLLAAAIRISCDHMISDGNADRVAGSERSADVHADSVANG